MNALTLNTATRSYAPAGDFHDWRYEADDARAAQRDRFIDRFYGDLVADSCCHLYTRIDDFMSELTAALAENESTSVYFNRLLFSLLTGGEMCVPRLQNVLITAADELLARRFQQSIRSSGSDE